MAINHRQLLLSVVCLGYFIIKPQFAQAAIIISEVSANPISGSEWIELINVGDQTADLTGYYLEDVLTVPSVIYNLTNSDQLPPNQVKVFNLPTTKLNNSGDGVTLKDPTGEIIDHVSFGASTQGESWQRVVLASQDYITGPPSPGLVAWSGDVALTPTMTDSFQSPTPTNIFVTPTITLTPTPNIASPSAALIPTVTQVDILPGSIQLSEVVACADDHGEWVEVINSASQSIDLKSWLIVDSSGNKRSFETTVQAVGLVTLVWHDSMLNNSGDIVKLVDSSGKIQETLNLPACESGESYAKINNLWQLTNQPSFNLNNLMTIQSPIPSRTNTPTPTIYNLTNQKAQAAASQPNATHHTQLQVVGNNWHMPAKDYLTQLLLVAPTPSQAPTLLSTYKQISRIQTIPNVTQEKPIFLWSGIISGLLFTIGGLLLTHVRFPATLPSIFSPFG